MLNIKKFEFNPFGESTYVVYNTSNGDAIVVDPGMGFKEEVEEFDKFVSDNSLKIQGIVNTHLHLDHCF